MPAEASLPVDDTADAARATTGASVIRGGLWNATSRFVPQLYTLVLSIAAARFLGPDLLGRQSFIAFVALSIGTLCSGGLSVAIQRFVGDTLGARDSPRLRGLSRWGWRVQALLAAIGAAAVVLIGILGASPQAAWILAGVACFAVSVQTAPSAVLTGAQRWREATVIGLVTGGIAVPAVIAVLALGGGVTGMFAVEAAVAVANLTWTGLLARRLLRGLTDHVEPPGEIARRTARFALQATLSTVLTLVLFTRSEFFFLERWSSDAEIALYSIAYAAQAALVLVPSALAAVMLPAFATLVGAGEMHRLRSGYARSLRLITYVSVPLTAAAVALGPALLLAVYGEHYAGTRPVLLIMVAALPIFPLMAAANGLLFALGRPRPSLIAGAIAAVVNLVLDIALIPRLDAVGAAIANTGGQATVALAILAYAHRQVGGPEWPRSALPRLVVGAALSCAAGLAAVSAIDGVAGLVVGIVVFALAFVALARILRILPAGDARWLEEHVHGAPARLVRVAARIATPVS